MTDLNTELKPITTEYLHSLVNSEGYIEDSLAYCDFTKADLTGLVFVDCSFYNSSFSGMTIKDVVFNGGWGMDADFSGAKFIDCEMKCLNIDNSNMSNTIFIDGSLEGMVIDDADMTKMRCMGTDFSNTNLTDCNLEYANIKGGSLASAILSNCNLAQADFTCNKSEDLLVEDCQTEGFSF